MTNLDIRPSLDYLMQYPVARVNEKNDDSGYGIEFEGGAIIGIEGSNLAVPEIEGKSLITVVRTADGNTLVFGQVDATTKQIVNQVDVITEPGKYFIIDPRFGGEVSYPDQPVVDEMADHHASVREQFNTAFADGPDETPESISEGLDHQEVSELAEDIEAAENG